MTKFCPKHLRETHSWPPEKAISDMSLFKVYWASTILQHSVLLFQILTPSKTNWAATWQNQQNDCAPSEDSGQPGHPPSLIRVFSVRWTQAFFTRTAKTLIRLGGCPCWSESSLGGHSFCWFCHVAAHLCMMDEWWMDEVGFYVPSTVFQSFRDDGRVNMKGSVQWSAV